ncbi:MAG: amidohydrolase family protein, partial [Stellaceae bacterium]
LKTAPNNSHAARKGKGSPRQFFEKLVSTFGAKRILWGSNYPAHWHRYGDLRARLELMQEDFSFLSTEDRAWVFGAAALALWPSLRGTAR